MMLDDPHKGRPVTTRLKEMMAQMKTKISEDLVIDVWRCTHAKLAPLTPHPIARDRHYGPASGQRGGT